MAFLLLRSMLTMTVKRTWFLNCSSASHSFSSWSLRRSNTITPLPSIKPTNADLLPFLISGPLFNLQPVAGMKCKVVIKKRCKDCYFVRKKGRWYIYCRTFPRHKQRQL